MRADESRFAEYKNGKEKKALLLKSKQSVRSTQYGIESFPTSLPFVNMLNEEWYAQVILEKSGIVRRNTAQSWTMISKENSLSRKVMEN